MYLLEKALEYIFVPSCGICGKLGEGYLCENCAKQMEKYTINEINNLRIQNKKISNNSNQFVGDIETMHIFKYKELIRETILQYKFNDKPYLYKTFCEFIVKNKKAFDFIKSYDIIIPVPMYKTKLQKRGYNQSELLARELAEKLEINIYKDVLGKIKNNQIQSSLNKIERENNIKNVYKLMNSSKIYNKKVLIFDDIYTTGATTMECARVIEKAGVKKIGILTLAKD